MRSKSIVVMVVLAVLRVGVPTMSLNGKSRM